MRPVVVGLSGLIFMSVVVAATMGCSRRKDDDGTAPIVAAKDLPALVIRDDTPNLLLTWIDDKGDAHVELEASRVPAMGRSLVRVIVSDREDGTKDTFYVVDLTNKGADGGYPARTMTRRAWETEIDKRRAGYLAQATPPSPSAPSTLASAAPVGGGQDKPPVAMSDMTVIIYGASWCKPCHDVGDYLKSKGIRFVHKDIEEDRSAALEMRDKLEKSGQRGGSIPVLDVRGQILVGYSPRALDRALAKASSGTAL